MLTINKYNKTWTVVEKLEEFEPDPEDKCDADVCNQYQYPLVPKPSKKHPRRIPYDIWYKENKTIVDAIVNKLFHSITEAQIDCQDGTIHVCVAVEKTIDDLYNMVYETSYNSLK